MNAPDRLEVILAQSRVTGVDYIYIHPDQLTLEVHFLRPPATLDAPLNGTLNPDDIRIYSPSGAVPDVPVVSLNWIIEDGEDVLRLIVAFPGDFTRYRFKIDDLRIDPYYNDVPFDFKANCPSDLDCAPLENECPPEMSVDFPVNYLARDFWSFRQALLEFASQRYPDWPDRLEADAGIMLVEAMSALGDEMAYYQDRIAREAYLETATQRRSLRRHARLVDYHLHDGLGATTWVDITVTGTSGNIPAGTNVWAAGDAGIRIDFEIGRNIEEIVNGKPYAVNPFINNLMPHLWDENQTCLPLGTTSFFLEGHHAAQIVFDDQIEGLPGQIPGKWVLLQTSPVNPAQPARAYMVRLINVRDTEDPVLNVPITHITWEQEQALPFELDMTVLTLHGNMLPAIAGKTKGPVYFVAGASQSDFDPFQWELLRQANNLKPAERTIEREGKNGSITHLFSLPFSEQASLVYIGKDARNAKPEVLLQEMEFDANWKIKNVEWISKHSFIGVHSSLPQDRHFTLDDGSWRRVVGYQRNSGLFVHNDYLSDSGVTIRFGDSEFGLIPTEKSVFRVYYRLGAGRRSNVAANTLKNISPVSGFTGTVTNPLAVINGMDAEMPNELRQLAPEAFRALTYRAVRPEDYAEAAERLSWVQRAGSTLRWTGSWLSIFTTPDPLGTTILTENSRLELVSHLDKFRQAGREVHVMEPRYANIDLEIEICTTPDAYKGKVKEQIMMALTGSASASSKAGYFTADNFTFGTALDRSVLEAIIQGVPGVMAVRSIRFRRRGWFSWRTFRALSYNPGNNTIIRVENNPLHPERGTIKLYGHGL